MMNLTVERIAGLAALLNEHLQEKLWEYAELLYVEQVAFDDTEPDASPLEAFASTDPVADAVAFDQSDAEASLRLDEPFARANP